MRAKTPSVLSMIQKSHEKPAYITFCHKPIQLTSPWRLQLLDTDTPLHFSLLRLQLIELIRSATSNPSNGSSANNPSISTALEFATTHLAPRAPINPSFLADLERTMALLIFPPENLSPQLAELVDPHLRSEVANRVNEAILHSQGVRREAQIRKLVRLRAWSEKVAREGGRKIDLPDRLELGLDEQPAGAGTGAGRQGHNGTMTGNGDTSMTGNGEAEGLVT
jgi:glucose-induced degradation protein 8